jgi:hypothetical protein
VNKAMKQLTLGIFAFLAVIVLLNIMPTVLDPQAEEFIKTQTEFANSYVPDADAFSKFLQENKGYVPGKLPEYVEIIKNYKARPFPANPSILGNLFRFQKWNRAYLESLSGKSERDRLQGLEILAGFNDEMARSKGTYLSFAIALASLNEDLVWMKKQNWSTLSEARLAALKLRVQTLIDNRVTVTRNALEGDQGEAISLIEMAGKDPGQLGFDLGPPPGAVMKTLYKLFWNTNATLNGAHGRMRTMQESAECLKDYSCEKLTEDDYPSGILDQVRNPIGSNALRLLGAQYAGVLKKTQLHFQNLETAVK